MNLNTAITLASELAYDEDANQVVGMIDGEWCVSEWEDEGRLDLMNGTRFVVKGEGPVMEGLNDEDRAMLYEAGFYA